jgi:hypothetical protein
VSSTVSGEIVSPKPNAHITLVAQDYAAGLFGKQAVKRDFAVVLKRDGSVDKQATRQQRKP